VGTIVKLVSCGFLLRISFLYSISGGFLMPDACAEELRFLYPPRLEAVNVGTQYECYRPKRIEGPALRMRKIGKKKVGSGFGMGGSGWTLGPTSGKYIVDLFEKDFHKKDEPIAILGAGVMGLFTAYELVQRGYTHLTIYAKEFDNLTSHKAGGLLAPTTIGNSPIGEVIEQIGFDAYRFYSKIARGEHPVFKTGARIMPAYFRERSMSGLEPYVKKKVMQPAKDVIVDFRNGKRYKMVAYDDAIFIDVGALMARLTEYLKEGKGRERSSNSPIPFIQREIKNFDELQEEVIFNCTGHGADVLEKEEQGHLVPVQGHLIMLRGQKKEQLQYMIDVPWEPQALTESGHTGSRLIYLFPKSVPGSAEGDVGVLGGTFIEKADWTTPNKKEHELLIERAREFFGGQP
jgi:D-amino-acid oxidase